MVRKHLARKAAIIMIEGRGYASSARGERRGGSSELDVPGLGYRRIPEERSRFEGSRPQSTCSRFTGCATRI